MVSIVEVDSVLRRSKVPVSKEEADILNSWRTNCRRATITGTSLGLIVTWSVTGRLSNFARANLAAVAGLCAGVLTCKSALQSSVEQCLSLNGTRLQRELAEIIVKKYPYEHAMKCLSKHFFCENVYDDSSSDKPTQRLRLRNFSGEKLDSFQRTEDDSYKDASTNFGRINMKKANHREDSHASRRNDLEQKVRAGDDAVSDPFDCVFGLASENVNEIPHQSSPDSSHTLPRKHGRRHRRSRRKHPVHHKETSDATY
ncbi:unnamed protein product [Cuscuta epithymum]|uniref:Uncharacterized protein n=2 Tax=Cuscuta epithymum TaxID=186058 RepID=A0AAV0C9R7_9ASTE|nr:unnamed protein product [Cuscuta epithymum]